MSTFTSADSSRLSNYKDTGHVSDCMYSSIHSFIHSQIFVWCGNHKQKKYHLFINTYYQLVYKQTKTESDSKTFYIIFSWLHSISHFILHISKAKRYPLFYTGPQCYKVWCVVN